jgi:hypothetical protein
MPSTIIIVHKAHKSYTQPLAYTVVAPPLSIASISASVHGSLANFGSNSDRSKNSPDGASTGPRDAPEALPMVANDRPFSGPCCCACWRYSANVVGSECEGEAGCAWGVWSIAANALAEKYGDTEGSV